MGGASSRRSKRRFALSRLSQMYPVSLSTVGSSSTTSLQREAIRERIEQDPQLAERLYIALYDYEKTRTECDLLFHKGDYLEVIEKVQQGWWMARMTFNTDREGFIPSNYVALFGSIEAEPWYFGQIPRILANNFLLMKGNRNGSFLVRKSESRLGEYAISVRVNREVRHYRVRQQEFPDGSVYYFITQRVTFRTLHDLVKHYRETANGLLTVLGAPCIKFDEPITISLAHNTRDDWEIPRSSLKFMRQLGQGHYGKVHQGLWIGKVPVAIKSLKPGSMDPKDFLAEAQLMKTLQHPNLIRLYAVCTTEEPIYIVTELMKNGSLLSYLRNRGRLLKMPRLIEMTIQIATAMSYLESKNYIHRDLAARNILVGENNIVKVADFGLARMIKEDSYEAKSATLFPIKWTAPEAISHHKFSTKSDVWSFGILLMEIVSYGGSPYPGVSNNKLLALLESNYRMPKPENCPQVIYEIMLATWNKEPMNRPTFAALVSMLEDAHFADGQNYREANEIH